MGMSADHMGNASGLYMGATTPKTTLHGYAALDLPLASFDETRLRTILRKGGENNLSLVIAQVGKPFQDDGKTANPDAGILKAIGLYEKSAIEGDTVSMLILTKEGRGQFTSEDPVLLLGFKKASWSGWDEFDPSKDKPDLKVVSG